MLVLVSIGVIWRWLFMAFMRMDVGMQIQMVRQVKRELVNMEAMAKEHAKQASQYNKLGTNCFDAVWLPDHE